MRNCVYIACILKIKCTHTLFCAEVLKNTMIIMCDEKC